MADAELARSPTKENAEETAGAPSGDNANISDEINEGWDSDLDEGDEVIERGYPRNHHNLEKHGFRPIWTATEGYPKDEIPADIKELLDSDGKCRGAKCVGPLRSLAWLAGVDELIEAIDSDAYTLEDSIEVVPLGAGFMFPVEKYIEEGKISSRIEVRVLGYYYQGPFRSQEGRLGVRAPSPAGVTETPTLFPLREITDTSRVQGASAKVLCMKVKSVKDLDSLERRIFCASDGCLSKGKFWFRGLTVDALKSTLSFFIPEVNYRNRDNEFGPGIYTSDRLGCSLRYLQGGPGAILVFKEPDLLNCSVWQPSLDEWLAWVAKWTLTSLDIASRPTPPAYDIADFIKGPIGHSANSKKPPAQSNDTQVVAVSYKGCQTLSEALFMIIFLDSR